MAIVLQTVGYYVATTINQDNVIEVLLTGIDTIVLR